MSDSEYEFIDDSENEDDSSLEEVIGSASDKQKEKEKEELGEQLVVDGLLTLECEICYNPRYFYEFADFICGHSVCEKCFATMGRDKEPPCHLCRTPLFGIASLYDSRNPAHQVVPMRIREAAEKSKVPSCSAHPAMSGSICCQVCNESFCSECIPNHDHGSGNPVANLVFRRNKINKDANLLKQAAENLEKTTKKVSGETITDRIDQYYEDLEDRLIAHARDNKKRFLASFRTQKGQSIDQIDRSNQEAIAKASIGVIKATNLCNALKTFDTLAETDLISKTIEMIQEDEIGVKKALKRSADEFESIREFLETDTCFGGRVLSSKRLCKIRVTGNKE
jgi:hypothetical protein